MKSIQIIKIIFSYEIFNETGLAGYFESREPKQHNMPASITIYMNKVVRKYLPEDIRRDVDIGQREGWLINELSLDKKNNVRNIIGVDFANNIHAKWQIFIFVLNTQNRHLPHNSTDVVNVIAILEHVSNTQLVLSEICRVLTDEGLFVNRVPYNCYQIQKSSQGLSIQS